MTIRGSRAADASGRSETPTADDRAREAAERLVGAVAARDYTRLFDALARDARFRYLIPSGPGQVAGAADVAAKYFEWFGDAVALEVQEVLVERVSDRTSARYRFLLREGRDWEVVEQQAYLDVDAEGRIAGDRPPVLGLPPGRRSGRTRARRGPTSSTPAPSAAPTAWPASSGDGSERSRSATCSW